MLTLTHTQLESAAHDLKLKLSQQQLGQLLAYVDLVRKWNKTYNLVGTSEPHELLQKHLLDCIAIAEYVQAGPVLDVGSGAGLPGIPLAITLPAYRFILVDANSKKTRFMRQVVIELNLSNVEIMHTRVENFQPESMPRTVIARAFAPVQKAMTGLAKVCAQRGQILLMLGERKPQDLSYTGFKNVVIHDIKVPGLNAQRHLLVAERE